MRRVTGISRALVVCLSMTAVLPAMLSFAPSASADADDHEDDDKDEGRDEDDEEEEQRPGWCMENPQTEVRSTAYDSLPYWKVGPTLCEIDEGSDRVRVETIGKSAGGRDLFLAVVAEPDALRHLGEYLELQAQMVEDPEEAIEEAREMEDFKVPVYIHASIHGGEYAGTDASIELIKTLAFSSDPEVMEILDKVILVINVVANPDGRVSGTRANANGFDLNRDFVTLSQPETQSAVKVITEWNPLSVLDLHGFVRPYLIEPTTPPHNPSYEYDLYIKLALPEAEEIGRAHV